jgi:hypothetical protein
MICCGLDRVTSYCPECGKQLVGGPLAGLLKHCRIVAETHRTAIKNLETPGSCDFIKDKLCAAKLDWRKKKFEKWNAWSDQLEKLLQSATH